jgi:hypothetical protein
VEGSEIRGKVKSSINSTFLALIPKENKTMMFGDYRPIAICNFCYKLIAKVIANSQACSLKGDVKRATWFFKRPTDFGHH